MNFHIRKIDYQTRSRRLVLSEIIKIDLRFLWYSFIPGKTKERQTGKTSK